MYVTSVEQYEVTTNENGSTAVMMRGGLECSTEVGRVESRVGNREASEHATYRIDAWMPGSAAGDQFAFTVFFDESDAPVNFGIFGPEFVFTGEVSAGEVTIVDPCAQQRPAGSP